MHSAVKLISAFCVILMCSINPLPGALSDFDKNVKREQKESKERGKHTPTRTHDESGGDSFILDLIVLLIWTGSQVKGYTPYPYSGSAYSNFVVLEKDASIGTKGPDVEVVIPESVQDTHPGSGFFLAIDIGGQYAYSNGMGCFASVTGRFWKYIGPELEYKRFWDGDDYLDMYAAGLNIPLFQRSGFILELYGQGAWMRGVTRLSGWIVGGIIRSFPFQPVVLQFRCGYHVYDDIEFTDLEGRAGVILWRVEFFGGYRYLKAKYAQIDGPVFGIRVWI